MKYLVIGIVVNNTMLINSLPMNSMTNNVISNGLNDHNPSIWLQSWKADVFSLGHPSGSIKKNVRFFLHRIFCAYCGGLWCVMLETNGKA